VEKQLTVAAYWLGLVSTVLALVMRGLALFGVFVFNVGATPGRNPISYRTFLEGSEMFFLMAIAGAVVGWAGSKRP
jgi:hypothetical protein